MGFFDKLKKEKAPAEQRNAYEAKAHFYAKPDGTPFAAFALTEETDTLLPRSPRYAVGGKPLTEYRLLLVSTSKDGVVGELDYFEALKKLESYAVDRNETAVLIRGLSLQEMDSLR